MIVRAANAADLPFLRAMLYEAAAWLPGTRPPVEGLLADPHVARYLSGWVRPGDLGLVAEEDGVPLGAAWFRLFEEDEPGYGFAAADVPELSIGVTADARGRGIGTRLLEELVAAARADGYRRLSLSVEPDNPARSLYERVGFVSVGVNGGSLTMVLELRPA